MRPIAQVVMMIVLSASARAHADAPPRCEADTAAYADVSLWLGGGKQWPSDPTSPGATGVLVFRNAFGLDARTCDGDHATDVHVGPVLDLLLSRPADSPSGFGLGGEGEIDWSLDDGNQVGVRAALERGFESATLGSIGVRGHAGDLSFGIDAMFWSRSNAYVGSTGNPRTVDGVTVLAGFGIDGSPGWKHLVADGVLVVVLGVVFAATFKG